jgi:DHA1 family bicyclomycin/chloramphenicol resistance-like MFS transporter
VGAWAFFGLQESRSEETAAQARQEHIFRAMGQLLRNRRLVGYALAGAFNGSMLFSYISASADLIMGAYQIPARHFGWIFGMNAAAIIGAAQINRSLLRYWTADRILSRSSLIALAGAVALAFFAYTGLGGMWTVLGSVFFVLGSYGFIQGNTMAGALSCDPRRAGTISALMGSASFGAGAIVSSLMGLFHDGTARPIATTVLLVLAGSSASLFGLTFRSSAGRS